MTIRPPVVIVGGGPAGSACACRLAQLGIAAEVLERSTAPHDVICGEFLSIEAQQDCRRLGIDLAAVGARPIARVRLASGRRDAATPLPFAGASLTRRVLDQALLDRAAALGATVRRGVTARAIEVVGGIARLTGQPPPGSTPGPAPILVLATGKHGLRGAMRHVAPGRLVGFKTYWQLADEPWAALDRTVEVHLFAGGYAGLQPVEGGRANLCLLIDRARLAKDVPAGEVWPALLARLRAGNPLLAARLHGAQALLDRPLTIAGVPYGFVHSPVPADPANLYRVGDQMAVIPSFSGDGLSIALRTGIAAAEAIAAGTAPMQLHAALRRQLVPQLRTAGLVVGACRTAIGRSLMVAAAGAAPRLLSAIATATRLRAGPELAGPIAGQSAR